MGLVLFSLWSHGDHYIISVFTHFWEKARDGDSHSSDVDYIPRIFFDVVVAMLCVLWVYMRVLIRRSDLKINFNVN